MAISQAKSNQNKLTQMPSKLRKAIGVVKDQTSLSLAKVSIINTTNTFNLEIAILKATSHHESRSESRHVADILHVIASDRARARSAAHAIGKRVGKSRDWVVALKSLLLLLRAFQDGDPHFPAEVRHVMRAGTKVLNLSSFKDDSNPRPWDFTSFVRAFALYLDERLDCQLSGKLHRLRRRPDPALREIPADALIDRVTSWQRLLDRAVAAKPAGAATTNRLVQSSLYAVVQESFDLYEDVSDGLALLLDAFFELPYQSCVDAFHVCVRASKQFEELSEFHRFCKEVPVGRTSEYPSVQKISGELLETLQDFLKDRHVSLDGGDGASPDGSSQTAATLERLFDDETKQWERFNPFLAEEGFPAGPTFVAAVPPTFCARDPDGESNDDPFEWTYLGDGEKRSRQNETALECCEGRKSLEQMQHLWIENQKKIITKRMA